MNTRCHHHKDRETAPRCCATCQRIAVEAEIVEKSGPEFLDTCGTEASAARARQAHEEGLPVVADTRRLPAEILHLLTEAWNMTTADGADIAELRRMILAAYKAASPIVEREDRAHLARRRYVGATLHKEE